MQPDRFLQTARGAFAVLESGPVEGPRALCVHGFPDTPAGMRPLADALARRGYRTVSPWLRGYWPSPLEGPFHMESLVADLRAIDDALEAERGAAPPERRPERFLVGHDWGAVIGWKLLGSDRRFRHAAMLAVPHPLAFARGLLRFPGQLARSRYMAFFQLGKIADRAVARDRFAYVERLWREWSPGFDPGAGYWAHLRETLERSHPAPLEYYRALFWPPRAVAARAREGAKERIETPVLQLMGRDDGCIAPSVADGQSAYCDALTAEVVDGVGHFLHFEAPERVAARIHTAFTQR